MSHFGPGTTSGIGSMPGEDIRDTTQLILGELSLPHLPELPARPYGDLLSRAAAIVTQLEFDLQPAGWRLTGAGRPSLDQRRARSLLGEDLDVLEEYGREHQGPLKIQVTGPWTLAATVERPRGDKILADHGARRDLADALADGLAAQVADVRRRIPGAQLVVQLDEPGLPAVLRGSIPTASGWGRHRTVDEPAAVELLERVLDAAGESLRVVHCCAAEPPVGLFRKAGAQGVALDLSLLREPVWEAVAEAVEDGVTLFAGVVRTSGEVPRPEQAAEVLTKPWHQLGLTAERLTEVVLTPACGLAGSSPGDARARLELLRRTAEVIGESAES